jgi:hypothetical protein
MERSDKAKQLAMDIQNIFDTEGGKRVLDWLSDNCFEHKTVHIPNSPTQTALNEGKRCVILEIRKQLEKDPNLERKGVAEHD